MDQIQSRRPVTIMAVAAGICVANIYYNQPILKEISQSMGVSEAKAGYISVITQAGYGLGLFFLTPLGDRFNRKNLILTLQALLIISLLGMMLINHIFGLYVLSFLIGLVSVAAQVILPMAASLYPQNRGKTVGIIFTGILVGILGARVFSGFIAEWLGWRAVYGISSLLVLGTVLMIKVGLPDVKSSFGGTYRELLGSTLQQVKRFALLRKTALLGALVFGTFCSFWTTLTFHLAGPPFNYRTDIIGLFGLLAIGGALLAPVFGKGSDKGNPARSQVFAVSLLLLSLVVVKIFPTSLAAMLCTVLLLDIGVQGTQVTNVALIYTLDDKAHSRINTVYMTTYFLGGAIGTYAGVQCWRMGGWRLVVWQLITWAVVAFLLAVSGYIRSVKKDKRVALNTGLGNT